ncbi:MAG: hypothetical protein AABX13_01610 [Nanoarchaeota archaeon]
MKTIIVISLLLLSVVLLSCLPPANEFVRPKAGTEQATAQSATPTTAPAPSSPETTAPSVAPSPASTEPTATSPLASGECTVNADCAEGTLCIDGSCATIASLYNTAAACAQKCTVETVDVTTSDGEKYTLARTQGSYTAAGALEWKVGAIPLYCPGEKKLIPFHFFKKTTGKVISEEVVTVEEGQTSPVITHPTVSRVKFTVTVNKVKEVC